MPLIPASREDIARQALERLECTPVNPPTAVDKMLEDFKVFTKLTLAKFISVTPEIEDLKHTVEELADEDCNAPVLITGPSGVGKQIIAEALHGTRSGKFVDVNCAALPEQLVDSLLFGHVVGAFTGAVKNHPGFFQEAKDGTIFLDEIHALPVSTQQKILKVIETKRVLAVGARLPDRNEKLPELNFRVVAATNKNLRRLITEEKFLLDLYARIYSFELFIPGLHDRTADIPPILRFFAPKHPAKSWGEIPNWVNEDIELFNVRAIQAYANAYNIFGEIPERHQYQMTKGDLK